MTPVPFNNFLTINIDEINIDTSKKINVEIINTNGAKVYNNSFLTKQKIQINTSQLTTGIYLVRVSNGNASTTIKAVKGNILLDKNETKE
ncbi:T9SS type A sorting domain-containing protein [Polaribacter ponticola]|uniref:T9SS type A sorting domain-containing protein n=1 Tax=Polaribacter ponticola TaxID=2978475 RepID=UPI003B66EF00